MGHGAEIINKNKNNGKAQNVMSNITGSERAGNGTLTGGNKRN